MKRGSSLLYQSAESPHDSVARPEGMSAQLGGRVLFVSNGAGEDEIACRLATRLRTRSGGILSIEGWPLVGDGDAYRTADIPGDRARNQLPSEGFGTLSFRSFVRDVRAGWLRVHIEQVRDAVGLREHFDLIVAIGDIVPLVVAHLAQAPLISVGCAKSVYYGPRYGFNAVERWILKQRGATCFTRDARTARMMRKSGVHARYVGNPMMDDLTSRGLPIPWRAGESVVACLPGSRSDREQNAVTILRLVALASDQWHRAGLVHLAFALPRRFELDRFLADLSNDAAASAWQLTASSTKSLTMQLGDLCASLTFDALGDVLDRARVAIALGGTVNEQAIGRGVPCVTFATSGPQGRAYLRMKMPYFGEAVTEVPASPTPLVDAVRRILYDDVLHARMRRAGAERMGGPGGTDAIVDAILHRLEGTEQESPR